MPLWNKEYFDCRWGLRDFRQGAITMAREFISPNEAFAQADGILSQSSDHSINVDHEHYGRISGGVPRLSNNTICHQRWLSLEWSSFYGLGPYEVQKPIRLTRNQKANGIRGPDVQSICDQVAQTTTTLLKSFFETDIKAFIHDAVATALQVQTASSILPSTSAPPLPPFPDASTSDHDLSLPPPFAEDAQNPPPLIPTPELAGQTRHQIAPSTPHLPAVPSSPTPTPTPVYSTISSPIIIASPSLKRALEEVSDDVLTRSAKRLCAPDPNHVSIFDDLDMSSSIAPLSSQPQMDHNMETDDDSDSIANSDANLQSPLTPLALSKLLGEIRRAIQLILKDPTAKEKSREQLQALVHVITSPQDLVVIMKTGGGKSLLWMVPLLINKTAKYIVVCPYVALLDEQFKKTQAIGLSCHNYSHSKSVPDHVRVLFVQVEHCSSKAFAR